ncbi:NHS-like protein 1 isoform X2 [Brienomyrus brachyistius]|uniref:NHS-like protein 1 isoform X2 n=1 Tax=Brienomyrus brachyistius TaxID=42636 RepID=UPI0020B2BBD7|nr:NHS-like protein 1 isoform X2 [Brienomyrus brachyistius]
MPFYQRTVGPACVCRLKKEDGKVAMLSNLDDTFVGLENHRHSNGKTTLFTSLEEVWNHTLTNVLRQLSDLSRHASSMFLDIEIETKLLMRRSEKMRVRLESLQNTVRKLDHKKAQFSVSSLDEESKWTVHYSAPWHQQENVFLPCTRPACVEDLHRQAKVNLKTVLRECDRLRKDGFCSSQYYSQGPASSSRNLSDGGLPSREDTSKKSTMSSAEEERLMCSMRLQSPLLEEYHINGQMHWSKTLPLPTPEEKMRQQAQCVPIDIIPINVTGTGECHSPSTCIPSQYFTLGRVGSVGSALRRSGTRDSGCQTEDTKIVPPSMRRIRAQKGHGIAAQMANLSNSSTGSISTINNSTCTIFASELNRGDQRCYSLPRQGTRTSLQGEPNYTSTSTGTEDCIVGTLSHQISKLQTEMQVVPLRTIQSTDSRLYTSNQERREFMSCETLADPTSSPHGTCSVLLSSNNLLTSSVDGVSSIEALEQCAIPINSAASYHTNKPLGSPRIKEEQRPSFLTSVITPCRCDSAVSLSTGTLTETESQCSNPDGMKSYCSKDTQSESSYSYGSLQSCSPPEKWNYDTLPKKTLSSSCSTPINHICSNSEHASKNTESFSPFSFDNDGSYTSMNLDSGQKSCSYNSINGVDHMKHCMYECKEHNSQDDQISLCSNKSLSRSISLRKTKKPPLPPTRTDSLRRKPEKDSQFKATNPPANSPISSETLQESLQMSLKTNNASSPAQSPSSDCEDPWVLRSHSQSTISDCSSLVSPSSGNLYSICPITPSQSDCSSLHLDCAESLARNGDSLELRAEQLHFPEIQSSCIGGSPLSQEELHSDCKKHLPLALNGTLVDKAKRLSLPEKMNHLTSPTSSLSNQVSTLPSLKKFRSPARPRSKPKVPERKSSLLSSVSASPIATPMSAGSPDPTKKLQLVHSSSPMSAALTTNSTQHTLITTTTSVLSAATYPDSSPFKVPGQNFPSSVLPINLEKICATTHVYTPSSPEPIISEQLDKNYSSPATLPLPPPYQSPPPLLPVSGSTSPQLSHKSLQNQAEVSTQSPKCDFSTVNTLGTDDSLDGKMDSISYFPKPLITAQALHMVQLRPVEKVDRFNNPDEEWKHIEKEEKTEKPEMMNILPGPSNVIQQSSSLVIQSLTDYSKNSSPSEDRLGRFIMNGQTEDLKPLEMTPIEMDFPDKSFPPTQEENHSSNPLEILQISTITQKNSPSPKKPKLTLTLPPVLQLLVVEDTGPQVVSLEKLSVLDPIDNRPQLLLVEGEDNYMNDDKDEDSGSLLPLASQEDFLTIQHSKENSPALELDLTIKVEDLAICDERNMSDGDADAASNTTDSFSSKEEDDGEVFDFVSLARAEAHGEEPEDMVTPTRPRTTEDLFAAIHRSKRKVLGWRESEEDRPRVHSSSPPVTPTGVSPGLSSRQSTCIQRSLRKTATSNDSFKALLLKKGSRPEGSFRMSAAEILRSTDPRHQRAQSDSALESPPSGPGSPCASPGPRTPEEWARTEGLLPRFSPVFLSNRHGRLSTPPSAASSRYNARNRILSSPMTAISEREGELAEAADCCGTPESRTPPGTPPSPISTPEDKDGTPCEDGR